MNDYINNLFPTYRSGSQGAACNTTFEPLGGLTLRDLFAMAALVGVIGQSNISNQRYIALAAYDLADAMLAAREEDQK